MINWKGCGRKRSWPQLRDYPSICLEGLRKTLSQDSWSSGRDLNLGPSEDEAEAPLDHNVRHNCRNRDYN
jgi:hypothetical protein